MSDDIKHECGLAYIRLRKPFSYYLQQHGSVTYGLSKLYLLMEKQHNRGQDGAGFASVKLNTEPGNPFLYRLRSNAPQPIADLFFKIGQEVAELEKYQPDIKQHPGLMKGHLPFLGELLLGHLRYGTQGKNNVEFCHPFIKRDLMPGKNLALAGNFNLVNTDELFDLINMSPGEFQKQSDLAAMLEVVHHFLTKEDELNPNAADIVKVLKKATPLFDGGYTIGSLIGNGYSFVMRDAHGIRPAYYYIDDEVIVSASERAAIRTTFNVGENEVMELMPGSALIVDDKGNYVIEQILEPKERRACSFERIYFSRGSDEKIYRERIALGHHLSKTVLESINYDLKNTIFSYIPNTAEVAYYGLMSALRVRRRNEVKEAILKASQSGELTETVLDELILRNWPRGEKVVSKDIKLRTFIGKENMRNQLGSHVYDITYGSVEPKDNLVCVDDSIVRGTTLRRSILRILSRLNPKKIIILSTAPQIRYPDCYGIDMSELGKFIAFEATVALLKESGREHVLEEVYNLCRDEVAKPLGTALKNQVSKIYESFTPDQISAKIVELVRPSGIEWKGQIEVIFQTIENLHAAVPKHTGDWYFTGKYPTPGGYRVVNQAYIKYYEKLAGRSY